MENGHKLILQRLIILGGVSALFVIVNSFFSQRDEIKATKLQIKKEKDRTKKVTFFGEVNVLLISSLAELVKGGLVNNLWHDSKLYVANERDLASREDFAHSALHRNKRMGYLCSKT